MISPEKEKELLQQMAQLNIREEDLIEKFVKGSGPGGQKINKTSSCVYILHIPSGIEVKCQRTRSQASNRFFARRTLCERLAEQLLDKKMKRQQEISKIRRQKQKRSKRHQEKVLRDKHIRSETKARRKVTDIDL
ncbi:MAG: peptide chain release factor-like protein [Deltaproteobacteria bacterium]|nr:peptide chain release factor-like protein [Deltaproteobacteria bacterium]